jgi:hypothetical protein
MGIPKKRKSQTTPDEGVLPGLDSALIWYCGETISVPLGKRRPRLGNDHDPSPRCQSGAKLPYVTRSPQNRDNAGSPNNHVVSDFGFSSFESSEGRGRIMSCVCSVSSSVEYERAKSIGSESESCSPLNSSTKHQYPSKNNAGDRIDSVFEGALSESSLRLSPIGNNRASDIQSDDFESGAATEERSNKDKSKLIEDSLERWTVMEEATFMPGTKMEEAILVQDPAPGAWGTKIARSRRRPIVSTQARLKPLQRQALSTADWQFGGFAAVTELQLEAAAAAALGPFESVFSGRLFSPVHHRGKLKASPDFNQAEGSSKQCRTDFKTSPDTIKQRLDAGLQKCMQLRLTETFENGGLLHLGDKSITALKSVDKKNSGFELRRSESDSSLLSSRHKRPLSTQGQIRRGFRPSKCWNAALSPAAHRSSRLNRF